MIDALLVVLAIAALGIGSLTDIKKREVPDWVSYGLIASALGVRLLYSILNKDAGVFLSGLAGFAVFFILAHIIYQLRQWGGGDAKIFMGLGAVIGLDILRLESYKTLLAFLIFLILFGAIYGLIYSIYLAIKNKNTFLKAFKENSKDFKLLLRFVQIFLLLAALGLIFINDFVLAILSFGVALILFVGIYSFLLTKSVEESCLFQRLKAGKLTEGDWVAQTIRFKGKIIINKKNIGISAEQIKALKGYKNLILVKLGIPFIPAFLLAFIALTYYKDVILGLL